MSIKSEVQQAMNWARVARNQAQRLFDQERERLIAEARAHGSEDPARDVSMAQSKVMNDIGVQERRDLREATQRYESSHEHGHAQSRQEAGEQQDPNGDREKLTKGLMDDYDLGRDEEHGHDR